MESALRLLFDYQLFQENAGLAKIISDTEKRYENILTDDELEAVAAAGEPFASATREDNPDD